MKKEAFNEFEISKLTLGTVQFGLNYGVANEGGKPAYETARDIIALARENGVNCLDTAVKYGESEAVLGKALAELNIKDEMVVVSKVPPVENADATSGDIESFIRDAVTGSLKRLGLDYLPICLFHKDEDFAHVDALLKLRDEGLVKHVGVSAGTNPDNILPAVSSGQAEAVQIPFNVFDKTVFDTKFFDQIETNGVALFSRSVYLQGLLLMPEDKILPELRDVIPARRQLETIAKELDMTMAELCMRYVISQKMVTSVLVGVDSIEQMKQNLAVFENGPLDDDIVERIKNAIPKFPREILYPCYWSKRM